MRLLKMELYKITARPVMNIAFFVMLGFFLLVLWQEADGTRTELDGEVYHGLEAIRADRQIAKGYEGPFTMEKAEDIVGRFGFSGYMEEGFQTREGNFSSQFVTDTFFADLERMSALYGVGFPPCVAGTYGSPSVFRGIQQGNYGDLIV